MSDTHTQIISNDQWSNRELTEAQQKNRQSAELIPFGERGITPQSFAQVVDLAKMMSTARGAVPKHLIGNTGACLAVIELGQKFQMSAYMLAMGCFSVNDMLAFTGQTVMAVMNKHLPLAKGPKGERSRLKYAFTGEHAKYVAEEIDQVDERTGTKTGRKVWINRLIAPSTRQITVTGRMENELDDLVYTSPTVQNIHNKKSPLWVEDEDQQLIYWASRRWQRRHWPEGLLGIYSDDELEDRHIGADHAKLIGSSEKPGADMIERVRAAQMQTDDADSLTGVREGFTKDHAHNETTNHKAPTAASPAMGNGDAQRGISTYAIAEGQATGDREHSAGSEAIRGPTPKVDEQNDAGATGKSEIAGADTVDQEPEHEVMPTTVAEWKVYALAWINEAKADPKITADDMNKKWKSDIPLRNNCGVSGSPDVRDEVYDYFLGVRDDKPKDDAKAKSKKK